MNCLSRGTRVFTIAMGIFSLHLDVSAIALEPKRETRFDDEIELLAPDDPKNSASADFEVTVEGFPLKTPLKRYFPLVVKVKNKSKKTVTVFNRKLYPITCAPILRVVIFDANKKRSEINSCIFAGTTFSFYRGAEWSVFAPGDEMKWELSEYLGFYMWGKDFAEAPGKYYLQVCIYDRLFSIDPFTPLDEKIQGDELDAIRRIQIDGWMKQYPGQIVLRSNIVEFEVTKPDRR